MNEKAIEFGSQGTGGEDLMELGQASVETKGSWWGSFADTGFGVKPTP